MTTSLTQVMPTWLARIEDRLAHWLPPQKKYNAKFHEAMRYSTLDGGKRIRPLLIYATGTATGQNLNELDGPACAVEMIHVYSLIHDDLPCMDDDDLRRGKPTCHRAYDEATAILVGDALQSLAFELLCGDEQVESAHRLEMVHLLARASGSRGMAGGQVLDIDAVGRRMTLPELENMHIYKTGALIRAAVQLGALASEAGPEQRRALDRYAKAVGLAFQVQDDILDVVADTHTLGKTRGKDQAADKPTYPSLLGLEGAREKAAELVEEALAALAGFGTAADQLRALARYVVARGH